MWIGSNRGMSTVEIVVVVAVAAVMVTIGVPQLEQSIAAYRLTASANLVAGELAAARSLAVSRATVHEVTLDAVNETIQITDPNDANNAPRILKNLERGVGFSALPSPTILFYGRGMARSGTIVLQNNFGDAISIVVTAGGKVTTG